MITLCIRYTLDPNKMADFRRYAEAEIQPITKSGGDIVGYYYPTEFAGPTNEAFGLIAFANLTAYEQYRHTLANDAEHQKNVTALQQSGAVLAMNRSLVERLEAPEKQ